MIIKDQNGHDKKVAGGGTTALGVIGTTLGGLAVAGMNNSGCNNGILGNLFGSNRNDCYVTKYELAQNQEIGTLESKLAYSEGKSYTDGVGIMLYRQLVAEDNKQTEANNQLFRETFTALAALDKDTAVNTAVINKNLELLNQKIDYKFALTNQNIEDNYVKAVKKISLCDVCPTPAVAEAIQPTPVCGGCKN